MPFALGSFFMLVLLSASGLLSIGNKDPSSNSGSRYDKGPFEPIPSQHDVLRTAGTVDPDTRVTSPVVSPPLRGLVEKIEARPAPVSSALKTVSDDVVVALPRRPVGEESMTTTSSGGDRPIRPERALYIPDILDPTRFSLTRTLTDESLQRFDLSRLVCQCCPLSHVGCVTRVHVIHDAMPSLAGAYHQGRNRRNGIPHVL